MTYYEDHSPYVYMRDTVPDGITALNIGWLDETKEFPRGTAPDGFTEALSRLCLRAPHAKTRGWHACALPHDVPGTNSPVTVTADGRTLMLGTAEVRVVSADGVWLAAPDLVLHYVTDHGYLPPADFIEAVLSGRDAPHEAV
ncbi:DUF7919 family protein [Streptomyces huiliensis]|uniref:DUF7919 family protein n=1 Tax=Streptomyces huiliensis TaxID=2876027 RepID=UPI001CBBDBF0|nr:hypothetical protein [Streptomyces huiliensis]MBZ4322285.1 hypothetical protein [Streptomyces huiliensis]